jgi:hypothetical protein
MACDEPLATAERSLLAALAGGPFTWDGSGFKGRDVRIVAGGAGATPAEPPDSGATEPGGKPAPDPGTVIEPDPGLDLEACREFIPQRDWEAVFGPATGRGGSTGGGTGSSAGGSGGGGSEPAPPPAVDPEPGTTAPAGEPGPGTGSTPEPTEGATEPAPTSSPTEPAPGPTPAPTEPAPGPTAPAPTEPAPAPMAPAPSLPTATEATAEPSPTGMSSASAPPQTEAMPAPTDGPAQIDVADGGDQPVAVDLPAPNPDGGLTRLPVKTLDRPAPTPSVELCRDLFSRIRTIAAGAPVPPASSDGKAESAATRDLAADQAGSVAVDPVLILFLVLAAGVVMLAWIRSIPTRHEAS